MKKAEDLIELISGSPQFRIKETLNGNAPLYTYYGQTEVEDDLVGMDSQQGDYKKVRTLGSVNTVEAGDVLFSLISGNATLVRETHKGYLFTQNYVKLVPVETLYPKYLIYLLNEDAYIKRQFQAGLQGSSVLKYTMKQLKELILPKLPSLEKQQLIGELYFNQLRLEALKNRTITWERNILLAKLREVKING